MQHNIKTKIFLNGRFIFQEEARLPIFTPGFLYGWGLFETMRSYKKHIVYFSRHLERIEKSCGLINIAFPYPLERLKEIIQEAIKINGFPDASVRLTLWRAKKGTDTLVIVKKYRPYPTKKYKKGFRACISRLKQNENSFLAHLKTSSYLFYQLAYLEAKNKELDEAIILNNRGYITEGSRTNIFLIKDRELFTPALECGCLDGITRQVVWDLAKKYRIPVSTGNFTLSDLYAADEAFFTNSLIGIMPLTYLERNPITRGGIGKITKFFMQKYNLLLTHSNAGLESV